MRTTYFGLFFAAVLVCTVATSGFAQSLFDPVIPRGPSFADRYAQTEACAAATPTTVESFFGFGLSDEFAEWGRRVSYVDPDGPAARHLRTDDLIITVNGDVLVDQRLPNGQQAALYETVGVRDTYIDRGIYVYGLRGDAPFEAVIFSCAGAPEPALFKSNRDTSPIAWTFNAFWPELHNGHSAPDLDERLVVAALTWISYSDFEYGRTRNPLVPRSSDYCRRANTVPLDYTITRSRYRISSSGRRYDETSTTTDSELRVDRGFYEYYTRHFDYIHNEERDLAQRARRVLRQIVDRYGCASPEFKDFERRVYYRFGVDW